MWWWWTGCAAKPEPAVLPPTAQVETWQAMTDDLAAVRHPSDGGGAVVLREGPTRVTVGEVAGWTVRYTAGPEGIGVGGRLFFQSPPFWGWSAAQVSTPEGPGFTVAEGAPGGVALRAAAVAEGLVSFEVGGRALRSGETIDVTYGLAGARADRFAEASSAMWFAVDGDGDGVRKLVPGPIAVAVTSAAPVGWQVTLQSVAAPGEPVRLTLAALDRLGNAFFPWTGSVALTLPEGLSGPERVEVTGEGVASASLTPSAPGLYVVRVASPDGLSGQSNPLVVRAGAERILWGDLQIHSALSDGTGSLDDLYRYARDVAGLDVAAVTDHDHWGMEFLDQNQALQAEAGAAAARWNAPGRFVALPGYEWTSWLHGHRHVVGFSSFPPLCSSIQPACDEPAELWAALAGTDALTFSHHSAGGPIATNWEIAPDTDFEPIVEIASVHGQSESADTPGAIYDAVPGTFVRDVMVSKGYKIGFIGSTDGHDGHPGLSQLAGGKGGLAAILAPVATPEAVREALLARRTYATNGVRMVLRFEIAGAPMGSALAVPTGPVEAVVRVVGTAPIAAVALVRAAGVAEERTGKGTATAHEVFSVAGLRAGDFVYVRVIQVDGGVAWSSPVWFGEATGPR